MIKEVYNLFYGITNGNNNEITRNNNTIGQNNKNYNNNTIDNYNNNITGNYNNNNIDNNKKDPKIEEINCNNNVSDTFQPSHIEEIKEVNFDVEGKSIEDKINILKHIMFDKTISVKNYVIEGNFSVYDVDNTYITIDINGKKETITDNDSQQDSKPSDLDNNLSADGYIISNNGVNNKHNNKNINNKNNNNRITFKALMEAVYSISGKTDRKKHLNIIQIINKK